MSRTSVLVIEDDPKARETLRLYIEHEGWRAIPAGDGDEGLRMARQEQPSVILLDLMLPRLDGRAVCAALRRESDVPIIMVTARSTEEDKLRGLEEGADDYITKPYSPREVIARIRAILRRSGGPDEWPRERHLRAGAVRIDFLSRRVVVGGKEVRLTPTELRILQLLAERPGRIWTRDELIARAFPDDSSAGERTVDAHIRNLRKKVDPGEERPLIVTVFGAGYRLDP